MQHGPLILPFNGITPRIAADAYLAPGVIVIGDVQIGAQSNLWPGVVVRGDVQRITIGERTNLQDGSIVHVTRGNGPTTIGSGITIGHRAILHACTLEDGCFIGMGAIVMDFAQVESGAMLAAGALLAPRKRVPSGELWAGSPAKPFRPLSEEEAAFVPVSAQNYVELAAAYRRDATSFS